MSHPRCHVFVAPQPKPAGADPSVLLETFLITAPEKKTDAMLHALGTIPTNSERALPSATWPAATSRMRASRKLPGATAASLSKNVLRSAHLTVTR